MERSMLSKSDIRMGDTVKIRNGENIVVDGVSDWYEDATGRHDGPWVMTKSWDRYPLSDVVEIAVRNERICVFCGEGVTAKMPDTDYCRNCHYNGTAEERVRAAQIQRLESLTGATVAVEHTGGNCFWMAFRFPNDGGYYYAATDGEASLPTQGEEWTPMETGGWGYVGRYFYDEDDQATTDAHDDYEGTIILQPTMPDGADSFLSDAYWNEYPK